MDTPSSLGQPQRLPFHKKEHSQTTIDAYLKPVANTGRGQNDIRRYFSPVAKAKVSPNGGFAKSSPLGKMGATSARDHDGHGSTGSQPSGPCQNVKGAAGQSMTLAPDIPRRPQRKAPAVPVRPPITHKHANSAVLPRFDPFFDVPKDFPHSSVPMAPRVTDVVRRSLVPRPLNIRLPPPPPPPAPAPLPGEISPSASETTSSPSNVADSDTASFDEGKQHRDAPSFKQTYSRVHSRQNTNEGPDSPLMALRDSSAGPWRKRVERPVALRSKTVPQMGEPGWRDSVIYFLPKISPTEDGSGDEGTELEEGGYPRLGEKAEAERVDVRVEDVSFAEGKTRREETKQKDVTVSPGMRPHIPHGGKRLVADVDRSPTVL